MKRKEVGREEGDKARHKSGRESCHSQAKPFSVSVIVSVVASNHLHLPTSPHLHNIPLPPTSYEEPIDVCVLAMTTIPV